MVLRGTVVNLTGKDIHLVNEYGRVLRTYRKSKDIIIIDRQETCTGMINSEVSLVDDRALDIRGLPERQFLASTFYIVGRNVALAAWQLGREMGDLLIPVCPLTRGEAPDLQIVGYRALMQAAYLFDRRPSRS